jgi:hypothetical protein
VEEEEGAEGLVFRGGGDAQVDRQVVVDPTKVRETSVRRE